MNIVLCHTGPLFSTYKFKFIHQQNPLRKILLTNNKPSYFYAISAIRK